jgi:hypothetical protein
MKGWMYPKTPRAKGYAVKNIDFRGHPKGRNDYRSLLLLSIASIAIVTACELSYFIGYLVMYAYVVGTIPAPFAADPAA